MELLNKSASEDVFGRTTKGPVGTADLRILQVRPDLEPWSASRMHTATSSAHLGALHLAHPKASLTHSAQCIACLSDH